MIRILTVVFVVTSAFTANASSDLFSKKVGLQSFSTEKFKAQGTRNDFVKIQTPEFQMSSEVGAPALPVKSWLIKGRPEQIKVDLQLNDEKILSNTKPFPVQRQPCRCAQDKVQFFSFNESIYKQQAAPFTLTYLGAFRGQPVSVLKVPMAHYDSGSNSVNLHSAISIQANASEFELQAADMKDYLIITPAKLADGVKEFSDWKRSRGFNVMIESLQPADLTTAKVASIIKTGYAKRGVDFVLIVGDEKTVPMFYVDTSGSSQTPSDLNYYTMDGADDHIPDMFAGRIVGATVKDVSDRLAKVIDFEKRTDSKDASLTKMIGIASNEGSGPSDNEYVTSIEDKFKQTLNYDVTHFFQNNSNSKPTELNKAFDRGASWFFYVGHGSGTSWPSMFQTYKTTDTTQINNITTAKPIIIDVACANGKLASGYLGTTLAAVQTAAGFNPSGMSAYYGGTVNISWDPPAIMARGIATEHMQKNFKTIGEALLAGQLYLAQNWTNLEEVVDNAEWYHLQGDPSMAINH